MSTRPTTPGFDISWLTHTGFHRAINEDAATVHVMSLPSGVGHLIVVADGLGGKAHGELASAIAVSQGPELIREELSKELDSDAWPTSMAAGLVNLHQRIVDEGKARDKEMATVTSMALVFGPSVCWAHVGDCRIYVSSSDGLEQLTQDHTAAQRLVNQGKLRPEQAKSHEQSHVLYQALGSWKQTVKPDFGKTTLQPGDQLILMSDGVSTMVSDPVLHRLVHAGGSAYDVSQRLLGAALAAGGADNIALAVYQQGETVADLATKRHTALDPDVLPAKAEYVDLPFFDHDEAEQVPSAADDTDPPAEAEWIDFDFGDDDQRTEPEAPQEQAPEVAQTPGPAAPLPKPIMEVKLVSEATFDSQNGSHGLARLKADGQVVQVDRPSDQAPLDRLELEASMLSSLAHPCIPAVVGWFDDHEGTRCRIRTFTEGRPLSQWMAEVRRNPAALPWQQRVRVVIDICGALGALVDHGVDPSGLTLDGIIHDATGVVSLEAWHQFEICERSEAQIVRDALKRIVVPFLVLKDSNGKPAHEVNPELPPALSSLVAKFESADDARFEALSSEWARLLESDESQNARRRLAERYVVLGVEAMAKHEEDMHHRAMAVSQVLEAEDGARDIADPLDAVEHAQAVRELVQKAPDRKVHFYEAESFYHRALAEDRQNVKAKEELAKMYRQSVLRHERKLEFAEASRFLTLLSELGREEDQAFTRGRGQLKLKLVDQSDRWPEAEVHLFRFIKVKGMRLPVPFDEKADDDIDIPACLRNALGWSLDSMPDSRSLISGKGKPLTETGEMTLDVPAETLLVIAKLADSRRVHYPVRIDRAETTTLEIKPLPLDSFPAEFAYIPEGRFIQGGDSEAEGAGLREDPAAFVVEFFMGVRQVSCGEYLEFLNDPEEHPNHEAAWARSPRWSKDAGQVWERDSSGKIRLCPPNKPLGTANVQVHVNWQADQAALGLSWDDAEAYADWMNRRHGQSLPQGWRFALPTSQQWEKAARGVDGRLYPWGDIVYEGLVSVNTLATQGRYQVEPAQQNPIDVSVYGVADCGGILGDIIREIPFPEIDDSYRLTAGGRFSSQTQDCRVCRRTYSPADYVLADSGIRLVIEKVAS